MEYPQSVVNHAGTESLPRFRPQPRPISSVGIVGAGLMGQSIAIASARSNIRVSIADASDEALARGMTHLARTLSHNQVQAAKVDEIASNDLLIEAIIEKAAIKQKLLSRLERQAPAHAIMASNTSSIAITQLADCLVRPERFCGLHFCHPVATRALVEVVRGERTSDETIDIATGYVRSLDKMPVVVKDGPGFLLNRLLVLYLNEAMELLLAGAGIDAIERAAIDFGMPMGPFTQMDEFGIDVALRVGATMRRAFPDRIVTPDLLISMYQAGRHGQKCHAGFFHYDADGQRTSDTIVEEWIGQYRQARQTFSSEQIMTRLLLPMVAEAARMLEENVVPRAADIDAALVAGIAFPNGGLLKWADSQEVESVLERLKAHQSLGNRFQPCALLNEMASARRPFYSEIPSPSQGEL